MTNPPKSDPTSADDRAFDDLLSANRDFAADFSYGEVPGRAARGVLLITCMDARIDPLAMVGLSVGDAKVIRSPGGRLTDSGLVGCIAGVHLLGVHTIMVVQHTRCAMASGTDDVLTERIRGVSGLDASWLKLGADPDQRTTLAADVHRLRSHPLTAGRATVGGFSYDVETGLLDRWV